jgi:alpha-1,2-mannosyltransferase
MARLTKILVLLSFVGIFLLPITLIALFSTPINKIPTYYTLEFFRFGGWKTDSWIPMNIAFKYLQDHPQENLYERVFFQESKRRFQYPPSALLIIQALHFRPIQFLSAKAGLSEIHILNLITWGFVFLTTYFVVRIVCWSLAQTNDSSTVKLPKWEQILQIAAILCLSFTFYPLIFGCTRGQIQTWISFATAVSLWCWMRDRKIISGILLGSTCLIKPLYMPIVFWGLLRKQWSFVLSFLATVSIFLLVSVLSFGMNQHLHYLSVLSYLGLRGETYYENQSINGALNRLFGNGESLKWSDNLAPFHPIVYWGSLIAFFVFILSALIAPLRSRQKGTVIDLSIVLLSAVITSVIAWDHYFGMLLPIYAILIPLAATSGSSWKFKQFWLYASYLLVSGHFVILNAFAGTNWSIMQSYVLIGALFVLGI